MASSSSTVTSQLAAMLRGESGINAIAGALQLDIPLPSLEDGGILELQAAADLTEKAGNVKYPVIHVYCDRIANTLKEKFRRFSGTADLNIEIRVSHDHIAELQTQIRHYVEVVTEILENRRGAWDSNTWYAGTYEVTFGPVKRGGRNYLQSAKVRLEVTIQAD
ncbi:MAG: hypothetical protein H7039_12935 [Bryobacteraceae bacterium]|nr:hypothetical protein [Bryobacteraceae bacterium]